MIFLKKRRKNMIKTINFSIGTLLIIIFLILPPAHSLVYGHPGISQDKKEEKSDIKELTIRNSGFRSRSTVVIRYQDKDKKIVEVIENGKSLPPSEFPRYESVMRKVLELPKINQLLPEIDEAYRRAESLEISEEAKLDQLQDLRRELESMDSDVARRYRDLTEFKLMESLHRMSEEISKSEELSQQEKIERLKELLQQSKKMELERGMRESRTRLVEIGMENAARRLIEEISRSGEKSQQEKIAEIKEVLQQMQETISQGEEEKPRNLVQLEAAEALKKMVEEIVRQKELTSQEKSKQIDKVLEEATKMKLENRLMVRVEKFEFELHQLLTEKGLLPEGKAEFVLKKNEATINGKKLPKEIFEQILQLCKETLEKEFKSDTKIVLQLNEEDK